MADQDTIVKHVPSFAPRPEHIPADWVIWNAPRGMFGSTLPDGELAMWHGTFRHGIFYAAINPADVYAVDWTRHNVENDGYIVDYVTIEAARERLLQEYLRLYGARMGEDYIRALVDGFDDAQIRDAYWSKFYSE